MGDVYEWKDHEGGLGALDVSRDMLYLTLANKSNSVCHALTTGQASDIAFQLATLGPQPEPERGEYWWVEVNGSIVVSCILSGNVASVLLEGNHTCELKILPYGWDKMPGTYARLIGKVPGTGPITPPHKAEQGQKFL